MSGPEIASMGLNAGPNTSAIVAMEHEVLDRNRKLRGWEAAAKLHAETLVDGVGSVCLECSPYPSEGDYVEWPCNTTEALGLDRVR